MCSAINKTLSDRCTVSGVRMESEKKLTIPLRSTNIANDKRACAGAGYENGETNMYRKQYRLSLQFKFT